MLYFLLILFYNLFIFSISFLTIKLFNYIKRRQLSKLLQGVSDFYDNFDSYFGDDKNEKDF